MKYFDKGNNKLIFTGFDSVPKSWELHWKKIDIEEAISSEKNNRFILDLLKKYMPDKKGCIIEGGCGIASKVYSMELCGYNVIGIDFSYSTLNRVKRKFQNLKLLAADLNYLPIASSSIKVFWSLGLIEHFYQGYSELISEIYRVLEPGGFLFLSFVAMNPLRSLKARLGVYGDLHNYDGANFYQYALDKRTVKAHFLDSGFSVLEEGNLGGIKGLKEEVRYFRRSLQKLYDYKPSSIITKLFKYGLDKLWAPMFGHMHFFVLKKSNN